MAHGIPSSNVSKTLLILCLLYFVNYYSIHHQALVSLEHHHDDFSPPNRESNLNVTAVTSRRFHQRRKFRQLNVSEFPYKCGILLFYHIPCTGGASISRWFRNKLGPTNSFEYFTQWGRNQTQRDAFANKMEGQLQKPFGPNDWRLSQAHGCSLLPIEDESNLYKWRDAVESQGCKFILTTVVRDPLSHTISQLKMRQYAEMKEMKNQGEELAIPMTEWLAQLGTRNRTAPRLWSTQLDYFLFNCWDKNLDLNNTMTREEKVTRGIQLLRNHFDFVSYQNHNLFVELITKLTGSIFVQLRPSNQHILEINFTTQELDLMKQKIHENGDAEWINAIRHVYDGHLSYLF